MATTNVIKRNLMVNKADQLNLMNYCMPAILYAAVLHNAHGQFIRELKAVGDRRMVFYGFVIRFPLDKDCV
jgi:hypothetical protein